MQLHQSRKGFTLVEIMIVVAIIGILIAIAVPGFIRAREASRTRAIQADLKRIDDANQEYIIEYNLDQTSALPTIQELVDAGYLRVLPEPPVGAGYLQAAEVSHPGNAGTAAAYPSFDGPDPDGVRVHPHLVGSAPAP